MRGSWAEKRGRADANERAAGTWTRGRARGTTERMAVRSMARELGRGGEEGSDRGRPVGAGGRDSVSWSPSSTDKAGLGAHRLCRREGGQEGERDGDRGEQEQPHDEGGKGSARVSWALL